MSTLEPADARTAASNSQTEHENVSAAEPSEAVGGSEWRQPTAHVSSNPHQAGALRLYRKHQSVQVTRVTSAGSETIAAKVKDYQESGGSWYYELVDDNNVELWNDDPTWFKESQISPGELKK